MDELQKLIEKWDEQIALHRRVCDDPLMYTKENRVKNSHYAQAICAVVADLKKLTIPAVSGSLPLTDEKKLDLILRKYHGHTKDQWERELVKKYPYCEIPYLVEMVWNEAQGNDR